MEEEESSPSVAGDEVKEERPAVNPAALPEPSRRGLAAALLNVARGRWKRVKDLVSATKRAARLALLDKQDFQRENEQALGQAARGQLDVALVVGRQQDLTAINYARQGDASMYTSDVMAARHHNRTDGRVRRGKIDVWEGWKTPLRCCPSTRVAPLGRCTVADRTFHNWRQYCHPCMCHGGAPLAYHLPP